MLTPTAPVASRQPQRTTQQDLGKKDIFLKLLVAQMSNQDPLKPQDPTKMASQLAQFNMVEQQIKTNKLLGELAKAGSATPSNQGQTSASYLGHTVTVNSDRLHLAGAPATFQAVLDAPATQLSISIVDASGNTVRTMQIMNPNQGANAITWDGLTSTGAKAPQGDYRIVLSATDLQGKTVHATARQSGQVTAVRFTDSGTQLVVNGITVSPDAIREIRL